MKEENCDQIPILPKTAVMANGAHVQFIDRGLEDNKLQADWVLILSLGL